MRERALSLLTALKDKWIALEKRQKFAVAGVSALFLFVLITAIVLMTRPKWVELVGAGESYQTVINVQNALDAQEIRWQRSKGMGIQVQERDYENAKLVVMNPDVGLPESFTYKDAMESVSMSTTSDMVQESLLRAKVSDIERALAGVGSITSAVVSVELPPKSSFLLNRNSEGTASVILHSSINLSARDGQWVAAFVAGNFMDLKKENVYVADDKGNTLYGGVDASELNGAAGFRQEYENSRSRALQNSIKGLLAPYAYGGEVIVSPSLVYDYSSVSTESLLYSNPTGDTSSDKGLVNTETKESAEGNNASADAEPGVMTNNNEAPTYDLGTGSGATASYDKSDRDYLYNREYKTTTDDNSSEGKLVPASSSVGVQIVNVLNKSHENITEEELNGLTWPQYKEAHQLPVYEQGNDEIRNLVAASSGVPVENVQVMVVTRYNFVDKEARSIPFETIIIFVIFAILIILLAYGFIRKIQPDEVSEVEPELSVEELLVSTQLEEEKEEQLKKIEEMQEIAFQEDSEIKKQIMKFVDDRPDAVAQLLRNWINEDWE